MDVAKSCLKWCLIATAAVCTSLQMLLAQAVYTHQIIREQRAGNQRLFSFNMGTKMRQDIDTSAIYKTKNNAFGGTWNSLWTEFVRNTAASINPRYCYVFQRFL